MATSDAPLFFGAQSRPTRPSPQNRLAESPALPPTAWIGHAGGRNLGLTELVSLTAGIWQRDRNRSDERGNEAIPTLKTKLFTPPPLLTLVMNAVAA